MITCHFYRNRFLLVNKTKNSNGLFINSFLIDVCCSSLLESKNEKGPFAILKASTKKRAIENISTFNLKLFFCLTNGKFLLQFRYILIVTVNYAQTVNKNLTHPLFLFKIEKNIENLLA